MTAPLALLKQRDMTAETNMSKYRTEQDISISGWECGTEIECKMVVTYTMTEYVPASLNGPEESPQPEVESLRFFLKRGQVAVEVSMRSFIEDAFTNSDGFRSWLASEARDADEYAREQAADASREV